VTWCDALGKPIQLLYYPSYHSKYNPIERCWGILEVHWNGVVFQKWRWPFLHRPSKGIAVDKQANHDVMHLRGFREADRLADQAFNTRP